MEKLVRRIATAAAALGVVAGAVLAAGGIAAAAALPSAASAPAGATAVAETHDPWIRGQLVAFGYVR
ncbi:MAG: hypothetical protein JF597_36385 [Streptomyces sp.]|jgi:L-alanine-DL-glutamate epimerase-like enolase superfamily enzyme|uniref:hypothetical protein n=1 Tax=Streptomyces sp. TaxID=1931 RepID=UPI0025D6F1AD|nr:hypothetical protein [Streptomyces sp.]MBW8798857.1 hypothetical protein [Streptomyces sp.]